MNEWYTDYIHLFPNVGNKLQLNANSACKRNDKQGAINQFNFELHWSMRL